MVVEEASSSTELMDHGDTHSGSTPPNGSTGVVGKLAQSASDTHALDSAGKGAAILTAAVRDIQSLPPSTLPPSSTTLPVVTGTGTNTRQSITAPVTASQDAPVNSLTASQKMAKNLGWEPSFPTPTTLPSTTQSVLLPQHVVQAMALSGTPIHTHRFGTFLTYFSSHTHL